MTAQEIVDRVNAGEIIRLPSKHVNTFMGACSQEGVNCSVMIEPEPGQTGMHRIWRPELQPSA